MMPIKDNTENFQLQGLHRPFNKSLKSQSWVCSYVQKWKHGKKDDFYYSFYVHHLREILRHGNQTNPWPEGCISIDDAKVIIKSHVLNKEFKLYVKRVLHQRVSSEDRLIYKTYKNVSYYISLAKKLNLIDRNYELTDYGNSLAKASHRFYTLSYPEKEILFTLLLETDIRLVISLAVMCNDIEKGALSDESVLLFLKKTGISFGNIYVRSFKSNYMSVIQYWMRQLDVISNNGKIKSIWLNFFHCHPKLLTIYKEQIIAYQSFKREKLKPELKKEKKYKKLLQCYRELTLAGKMDLGYINLYDLRDEMHMSFERFNEFMNEFFKDNKMSLIILFNNTVSSIDRRRRFYINEKFVLKIRIIQKKTYGI